MSQAHFDFETTAPEAVIERRLPKADIITVTDVCVAADVSRHVVQSWIDTGQLPAVNIASRPDGSAHWRIAREAVLAFLRTRREGNR